MSVRAACTWAAIEFRIPKILGIAAAQNIASQGVLLRAGFVRKHEQLMLFQGREQPVQFFEFGGTEPGQSPIGRLGI